MKRKLIYGIVTAMLIGSMALFTACPPDDGNYTITVKVRPAILSGDGGDARAVTYVNPDPEIYDLNPDIEGNNPGYTAREGDTIVIYHDKLGADEFLYAEVRMLDRRGRSGDSIEVKKLNMDDNPLNVPYVFTMPASNVAVNVYYADQSDPYYLARRLEIDDSITGGYIETDRGNGLARQSQEPYVIATPDAGKKLKSISVVTQPTVDTFGIIKPGGQNIRVDNARKADNTILENVKKFKMPDFIVKISAEFE